DASAAAPRAAAPPEKRPTQRRAICWPEGDMRTSFGAVSCAAFSPPFGINAGRRISQRKHERDRPRERRVGQLTACRNLPKNPFASRPPPPPPPPPPSTPTLPPPPHPP